MIGLLMIAAIVGATAKMAIEMDESALLWGGVMLVGCIAGSLIPIAFVGTLIGATGALAVLVGLKMWRGR